jgi:hypothetical protein
LFKNQEGYNFSYNVNGIVVYGSFKNEQFIYTLHKKFGLGMIWEVVGSRYLL